MESPELGLVVATGTVSCQLTCFLVPACHWRCFTVELIGLLLFLHPCWFSVINSYTLAHFHHPSRLLLFLLFLCRLLDYTVERARRGGEIIDCFAALCLLCSFSCSPPFCKAGCSEKSHRWQNPLDEGFPVDALLAFSSIRIDSMLQFILTVQRFASWEQVCSSGQYRRTVHERREKIQCLSMNWAETGTFRKVTNVITLN